MKLDVKYSDQEVETLEIKKTIKFGFDKDAQQMIFKMFSKNIYSNPIGSVVREITSNCFDSHIESNVTDPVILKLTKENNVYYISFIDVGVGMSPERVEKQYASAFSSTKRNDNHQIGGFGVGSMSLLAYTDSYFLKTVFDGVEYVYNIRKGTYQPEADLLTKKKSTERNGTIIKLPVKGSDVSVFEREINRQLYYFENVIFEGFSPTVKNDYQIIEGKNFLYRGSNLYSYTHICLGRVAYPIDFDVLDPDGNDKWYAGNWDVPVAIKLEIGDINVTVSREAIDYTEETKKLIKNKLKALKEEMVAMLKVQHDKLDSLEDFFRMEDNAYTLFMSNKDSINISSFTTRTLPSYAKLNALNIPSQAEIIHKFYNASLFGKKKKRESTWDKSLRSVDKMHVYLIENEDMPRKKNAYMKNEFGHFYTLRKKEFTFSELKHLMYRLTPENSTVDSKIRFNQFRELHKEVVGLVEKRTKRYSDITVPDGYTVSTGRSYNPNYEIPITYDSKHGFYKQKIKISELQACKATIYYGVLTDEAQISFAKEHYRALFNPDADSKFHLSYGGDSYPIRFIMVSKSNLKYIQNMKNMKPLSEFNQILIRKRDAVLNMIEKEKFMERFFKLNRLFLNQRLFNIIDSNFAKVISDLNILRSKYEKVQSFEIQTTENGMLLTVLDISKSAIMYNGGELFDVIEETTKRNGMLRYVKIDNDFNPSDNSNYYSKEEIANILQLLTLAYVK